MSAHSSVRVDCVAFAKCGVKSLSHCRRYRGEDNYCKGCTLIRRKPRNRKFDAGGREMKKCTHCGQSKKRTHLIISFLYEILCFS